VIEHLAALVTLKKRGDRPDNPVATMLQGALPEEITPQMLMSAAQDKTTIRKFDKRLAIVLPTAPDEWVAWLFDKVPGVTELPKIAERVADLTRVIVGASKQSAAGSPDLKGASIVQLVLDRIAKSDKRGLATVHQVIADATVEAGLCTKAAVGSVDGKKLRKLQFSDQRLAVIADELAHFCRSRVGETPVQQDFTADDMSDLSFDAALLADMTGTDRVLVDLPARSNGGLAVLLFGVPAGREVASDLAALRGIAALSQGKKPARSLRKRIFRTAALVGAVALVVWLSLPAQLRVTAAAIAEPRGALALALPVGAFLDTVNVRVGDVVAQGDPIAALRAPDLEDDIAAYTLQVGIEDVSAQTALAQNNFAGYQLSHQKMAAARDNLARAEARAASLHLTAPMAGRVVSAVGAEVTGRYLQLGETVAVIQPEASFNVILTVSRVDAPLVTAGLTGEVWFRGIAGEIWTISIETPVTSSINPQTGAETLTVRGYITDEGQTDLFPGLAGFAKINAGETVRAKVLSRYALEYLRTKAWIWFGLSF